MSDTVNASLSSFKQDNYTKQLHQLNAHKYRDVCPQCGQRGRQVDSATYDGMAVGVAGAGYVEVYECPRSDCDAEAYTA